MVSANWAQASQLQSKIPHTYTAMEHLIMAMADANNNQGKRSIFGYDKGLKSYKKFEDKLRDTLLALTLDGVVPRTATAKEYHEKLILIIDTWKSIFPNWPDAHRFADMKLRYDASEARSLISSLIGVKR